MKVFGLLVAIAATALTAVPATAAVTISGGVAVAITGVSSSTTSIDFGTVFSNTIFSVVGTASGDLAGTQGSIVKISDLTATYDAAFSFTSLFGDFLGSVSKVTVTGTTDNRTVSAYVLGLFTPLGSLGRYEAGAASATFSFTQTGSGKPVSGSFTFASPPAPVTSVPEIATWSMMILGFGLMGASFRYRRRSANVTFA